MKDKRLSPLFTMCFFPDQGNDLSRRIHGDFAADKVVTELV
jgi:hypothetical protein